VSYNVTWHPDVSIDLRELDDDKLQLVALTRMLALREDAYLGTELRERYNMRGLERCRSIKFDLEDWKGKPRYRLVYENQPSDGAPNEVRVHAVGPREDLRAYAAALTRQTADKKTPRRRRGE